MGMPKCTAGGFGTTVKSNSVYRKPGMRNRRRAKWALERFYEDLEKLRRQEAIEERNAQWAEEWGGEQD